MVWFVQQCNPLRQDTIYDEPDTFHRQIGDEKLYSWVIASFGVQDYLMNRFIYFYLFPSDIYYQHRTNIVGKLRIILDRPWPDKLERSLHRNNILDEDLRFRKHVASIFVIEADG